MKQAMAILPSACPAQGKCWGLGLLTAAQANHFPHVNSSQCLWLATIQKQTAAACHRVGWWGCRHGHSNITPQLHGHMHTVFVNTRGIYGSCFGCERL